MSTPDRIWIEVAPQFPAKIPPFPSWNDEEADPSMNQTAEYVRASCGAHRSARVQALEAENARLRGTIASIESAPRHAKLADHDLVEWMTDIARTALRDL